MILSDLCKNGVQPEAVHGHLPVRPALPAVAAEAAKEGPQKSLQRWKRTAAGGQPSTGLLSCLGDGGGDRTRRERVEGGRLAVR